MLQSKIPMQLTNPKKYSPFEKLIIPHTVKKFFTFCRTQSFTSAHQLSLSIPSNSIYLRSILILSSRVCLCLPSGLFASGFPSKTPHAFLFSLVYAIFSERFKIHAVQSCTINLCCDSNILVLSILIHRTGSYKLWIRSFYVLTITNMITA